MVDDKNKINNKEVGSGDNPTASFGDAAVGPGEQIGPYKLLRILGEGGYGIVYLAERQIPVKRRVALKVIKPGMDTKQVIARFEAERQALAILDHPNIAHVFNAGTTDTGRPYFAMEYVKGDPITEHCDRYKLTIEERLKLFTTVCEAVQYAHQKAIIHRDIKPSNILVAYEGDKAVPMIIDFGVAKALSQSLTERTLVTEQAQMVGTPEYMSPEQAEMTGQDIDTRTDVYSLGVLLYELLTGTLPFDSQTLREGGPERIRRMIREQDPKIPSVRFSTVEREKSVNLAGLRRTDIRTLERRLHGELDWITLKAMDKDRTRRYQTAYALAEDIQRYLNQEPVLAGPPSTIYKFRKFASRNKGIFISVTTIAVVVILAAIISIILAITATKAKMAETEQRRKAEDAQRLAEQAQEAAETLAKQQEEDLYFNHIKLAYGELKANRPAHAVDLLEKCPKDLRNWEWRYLYRASHFAYKPMLEFGAEVLSFAFSPYGSKLAVFCADGQLIVHDCRTGSESYYQIRQNLEQLNRERETAWCQWVDFCNDCIHVAVIGDDHNVNLISIVSGETVQSFGEHTDTVTWIECSPKGSLLATASYDNIVRLWDRKSGALRWKHPFNHLERVAFSHNGEHLLVDAWLEAIEIYNVRDLLNAGEAARPTARFESPSHDIAMTADGRRIATALHDNTILITDGEYNEVMRLYGHTEHISTLAFTADGRRLVSASIDRTTRLWDTGTGREVLLFGKSELFNRLVHFDGDDCELILSNKTHVLQVLDASPLVEPLKVESLVLHGHSSQVSTVKYNPSGDQLASSGIDSSVRLWSTMDGRQISTIGRHQSCFNVQFSTDGQWIAANGIQNSRYVVEVWEVYPPHQTRFSEMLDREPAALTFSADSQHLIVGVGGTLIVFDCNTWEKIGELGQHDDLALDITTSCDGKYLASTSFNGSVKIWDATRLHEWQEGRVIYEGKAGFFWVGFSPDSKRLAVGERDGEIEILDVASGKTVMVIPGAHGDQVSCVCFCPYGKYIASCSADRTVRVWEAETSKLVDIFLDHKEPVVSVAFSPDGKHVASTGYDQTIRIWTPRLE
ncbi:protein kinase [Planctomycetota bacterium]